jgi:Flp pilus assembly protein TadG
MDSLLRRLRHDENGSVFVFVTLTIFVMMGMVGLALDGARYFSLNSELQDLADAAALAGARELIKGTSDGVTAAENQALTLLSNTPHWGETGSTGAQVATVSFAGPDNPDQPTASAADARYIIVTTVDRGVIPTMLRAVGATETLTTSARAVAMQLIVTCDVQPLMLCNPDEPAVFNPPGGAPLTLKRANTFSRGELSLAVPPRYAGDELQPKYCYGNSIYPWVDPDKVAEIATTGSEISISIVDCLARNIQGEQVNKVWDTKYADVRITGLPDPLGSIPAEFIRFKTPSPVSGPKRIVQLVR